MKTNLTLGDIQSLVVPEREIVGYWQELCQNWAGDGVGDNGSDSVSVAGEAGKCNYLWTHNCDYSNWRTCGIKWRGDQRTGQCAGFISNFRIMLLLRLLGDKLKCIDSEM